MSWKDCVTDAEDAGEIRPETARRARELFDEIETAYGPAYGPNAAPDAAGRAALDRLLAEQAQKKRQALLTARAQKRLAVDTEHHPLPALMDNKSYPGAQRGAVQEYAGLRAMAHRRLDALFKKHSRNILGTTRNRAALLNVVREAFGEDSGDATARAMAKAWGESAEELRRMFNAAGGHIGKREDWGLPQAHDARAIARAGYDAWRAEILRRLDLERMVDGRTGHAFTPQGIELALKDIFESIRTQGWADRAASSSPGGVSMANRRADPRFLLFRSADDWIAYQQRFGEADPFNAMMGHIDQMARDIALMRRFGPNPNAGLRYATNLAEQRLARAGGVADLWDQAAGPATRLRNMYGIFSGELNRPVNPVLAWGFGETRQWVSSAKLGKAVLSAVSDVNTVRLAAAANGLDFPRIVGRAVSLVGRENRQLAIRLGLIAEEMGQRNSGLARFTGEIWGSEFARRFTDFVFRGSGLSQWTQTWRWAFGMDALGTLADNAHLRWADLPADLRAGLERRTVGEGDWDIIRTAPLYEHAGSVGAAKFLRPDDVRLIEGLGEDEGDRLAQLLHGWVDSETAFAIPSVVLEARAVMTGGTQPGTVAGEGLRSVALLKSYSLAVLFTHMKRAATEGTWATRGGYTANLVLGSMLTGALALQLKDIVEGRDPRPMTTPEFWGAAMLQGGGAGIYGDFLFADQNRFGGGAWETLGGPVAELASDINRLTVGNVQQALAGEETEFPAELVEFMRDYVPGGNIWYARLALDRMIWSQAQRWADPDADDRFRRLARNRERTYGQTHWWRPGAALPDRAPDLSTALEPAPE